MHLTLLNDSIHTMVNALDLEITSRNHRGDEMLPGFKLNIVNSAWVQYDRPFERAFLDLLTENYDAELCLTDFSGDPEGSRGAINQWVSDETNSIIEDLIPDGAINALTWLVLANAIYFNGSWQSTFDEGLTDDSTFTLLNGNEIHVPMMSRSDPERTGYAVGEDFQAVELPYFDGKLSMVILLLKAGKFEDFEANLDPEKLAEILGNRKSKQVELKLPKFSFESDFGLSNVPQALGMQTAFDS